MAIQKSAFTIKGMTRDMAVSKFSPELAFENKNLRIIATEENTSFGLVNEKGTAMAGQIVDGIPIGQEIINDSLILFTTSGSGSNAVVTVNGVEGTNLVLPNASGNASIEASSNYGDKIYKFQINSSGNLTGEVLYSGDLGFSAGCPIESIGVYENEKIQKVYWTDGINQPRVINIAKENPNWNNNSFNFVQAISGNATVEVTKNDNSFGSFAPGVIQYCFSYYDMYSSETNIFYTTPLYYVTHSTRGASPEETVSCSFTIHISGYSNKFEYLRIYSIQRTSVNATPQARRVVDISLKGATGDIYYTDAGVDGEAIDPTDILYVGGEPIFAGTIAQKDNTLFLGDITMGRLTATPEIKNLCRNLSIQSVSKTLYLPDNANVGNYSYTSQLSHSNSDITYYRRGETYRLGLQAQHYTGKWSDVVFIKDYTVETAISANGSNMNINNLKATVNSVIISRLLADGYVKVRPMVVFPDANNRNIICEGVCCPTVYNVEDRYTNSPYVQSSWFFRPNCPDTVGSSDSSATGDCDINSRELGKMAEFRHNFPIPKNSAVNSEIQCISNAPPLPLLGITNDDYTESSDRGTWVNQNRECFYVDQSIFTFHSPDIEFDEALKNFDPSGLKFRVVGMVPIHAFYSDVDIQATAPSNYSAGKVDGEYKFQPTVAPGFVKPSVGASTKNSSFGWKCLLSGAMWLDDFSDSTYDHFNGLLNVPVGFVVYPWQKTGALNTGSMNSTTSMLQHKKMSMFRFSKNSVMFSSPTALAVSGIAKFDSDELSMAKVPSPSGAGFVYYGNVDKLVMPHTSPKGTAGMRDYDGSARSGASQTFGGIALGNLPYGYPIMIALPGEEQTELANPYYVSPSISGGITDDINKELANVRLMNLSGSPFFNQYGFLDYCDVQTSSEGGTTTSYIKQHRYIFNDTKTTSTDPVSIKYKSTPHLVVALGKSGASQIVLPRHNGKNAATSSYGHSPFWDNNSYTSVSQANIAVSSSDVTSGYLWLGEIYRDNIDAPSRFGGTSDEAIENNRWIPAGEPVSIESQSSVTIVWSQGDTYYQRYDCLKTYPFTMEDVNSVSDTLSFMCETRVNLDGRYDRNRGRLSNLYATPTNLNLINPVYSQQNNFFTYRGLNTSKINSTYFPNTITWSRTKTMGEVVDSWTGITLASVLDVDGDKGRVRALRRFNNDLLSFQDRGISQILYNESMQISSTAGVPIEIANSGKVSGKRYISNHIGCVNKWSICAAPAGIYFMDDIGKDIYLFDGKLNNISDRFGFHSWIISNFPNIKVWNPRDFATAGEVTYYDKVNGDVMFITNNTCLSFSEPLGNFSSFYSYEKTPYFSVMNDRGILWHKRDSAVSGDSDYNKYQAWWYREGDYNMFYGVYKPFYITVVANEHPTEDKVFNNLEYRGDTFKYGSTGVEDTVPEGTYLYENTFDRLETWNEYQNGIANLNDTKDKPSNLKKKFRIWRANIPRNTENKGGGELVNYRRDRMRNPWLYIKLSKEQANTNKTILHDLVVYYFE